MPIWVMSDAVVPAGIGHRPAEELHRAGLHEHEGGDDAETTEKLRRQAGPSCSDRFDMSKSSLCNYMSIRAAPRSTRSAEGENSMRVMVIVKASKESEAGAMPDPKILTEMGNFNEELVKAGVMLGRRGAAFEREGKARAVLGEQAHRHRRTVRRNQGAHRRLLDLEGEVDGGGRGMGQAMPESAQRRTPRSRSGRSSRLRSSATELTPEQLVRRKSGCARSWSRSAEVTESIQDTVSAVYVADSRRVLATLIRLLGDFDVAEEAMHDAFRAALEQWPREGVPANPRAWLVSAGRFKAIDGLRRRARFDSLDGPGRQDRRRRCMTRRGVGRRRERRRRPAAADLHVLPSGAGAGRAGRADAARGLRPDDRGDRAGVSHAARRRWRSGSSGRRPRSATRGIPYQVPAPADLPDRLDAVLRVIYLVFNEGYSASSGASLTRHDLSAEAIRLGRLLVDLLPEPEARRTAGADAAARVAARGAHVAGRRSHPARRSGSLAVEPRADRRRAADSSSRRSDRAASGRTRSRRRSPPSTPRRAAAAATDWAQIVGLYDVLLRADPSPVIELNRAVAMAMRDGPAPGLASSMRSSAAASCRITGRRTPRALISAAGSGASPTPRVGTSALSRWRRQGPRAAIHRTPPGRTSLIIGGMNGDRGTPQWMWDRFIDDLDRAGQAGSAADVLLPALAVGPADRHEVRRPDARGSEEPVAARQLARPPQRRGHRPLAGHGPQAQSAAESGEETSSSRNDLVRDAESRSADLGRAHVAVAHVEDAGKARRPWLVRRRHVLPRVRFDPGDAGHVRGDADRVNQRRARARQVLHAEEHLVFHARPPPSASPGSGPCTPSARRRYSPCRAPAAGSRDRSATRR